MYKQDYKQPFQLKVVGTVILKIDVNQASSCSWHAAGFFSKRMRSYMM